MGHNHHTITDEKYVFSGKAKRFTIILMIVGALLTGVGAILASGHKEDHKQEHALVAEVTTQDAHAPEGHEPAKPAEETHGAAAHGDAHQAEAHAPAHGGEHHAAEARPWTARIWGNLLLNSYFFMLLAVAGTFVVALNYLANAGWYTALKRVPEAMGMYLPVALITVFVVILLGKGDLYEWVNAEKVAASPLLQKKAWYLNNGFLLVGTPVIIALWFLLHRVLRKASIQEDIEGGLKFFDKSIKYSSVFTFFFAFSFSALSWLLLMSVEAEWFSTIFSVNQFAIAFVSGIAVITLLVIYLKSIGLLKVVNEEHYHDLGKFMFAFSIFWTYTWLAQYLLIWYANLPEEVAYYSKRTYGHYSFYFWLTVILAFIVPFFVLMTRNSKRNPKVLVFVSLSIILGHWLDNWIVAMPILGGPKANVGLLEIGSLLLFAGLFLYVVLNALSKAPLYAKNHPYIMESVHHDTGV